MAGPPQRFKSAILAVALAWEAQRRLLPGALKTVGRSVGRRVMARLDARRERIDADALL